MGMSNEARRFAERPAARGVSSPTFSADGETTVWALFCVTADRRCVTTSLKNHPYFHPFVEIRFRKLIMRHLASSIRTRDTRIKLASLRKTPNAGNAEYAQGRTERWGEEGRDRSGREGEREWSVSSGRRSLPKRFSLRFFPVSLVVRAEGQSE